VSGNFWPYSPTTEKFDPIAPRDRNHRMLNSTEPKRDLRNLLNIHKAAIWLIFAGLIPFFATFAVGLAPTVSLREAASQALLGWFPLLAPSTTGSVMLALGFAAILIADLRLSGAPNWYRLLRLPLSVGAIFALLLGLLI